MNSRSSRRKFLATAAGGALGVASPFFIKRVSDIFGAEDPGFPVVDYHAHALEDKLPLERIVEMAAQRGVKLGVVEHGGFGQPLSGNEALKTYIATLAGYAVYKGMQAEGLDWMQCFSKEVVAQLDYVLSDALTFPEKDGRRVRLWTPEARIEDKQDFLERYVDFNVQVISQEPIDIMANPTFLPDAIVNEYEALWTRERMRKVIDAAMKHNVAIEINSRFNIPSLAFLKMAKDAGVKFSFGSNFNGKDVGKLDYGLKMAKELGLKGNDMFVPAPANRKPILIRTFARSGQPSFLTAGLEGRGFSPAVTRPS